MNSQEIQELSDSSGDERKLLERIAPSIPGKKGWIGSRKAPAGVARPTRNVSPPPPQQKAPATPASRLEQLTISGSAPTSKHTRFSASKPKGLHLDLSPSKPPASSQQQQASSPMILSSPSYTASEKQAGTHWLNRRKPSSGEVASPSRYPPSSAGPLPPSAPLPFSSPLSAPLPFSSPPSRSTLPGPTFQRSASPQSAKTSSPLHRPKVALYQQYDGQLLETCPANLFTPIRKAIQGGEAASKQQQLGPHGIPTGSLLSTFDTTWPNNQPTNSWAKLAPSVYTRIVSQGGWFSGDAIDQFMLLLGENLSPSKGAQQTYLLSGNYFATSILQKKVPASPCFYKPFESAGELKWFEENNGKTALKTLKKKSGFERGSQYQKTTSHLIPINVNNNHWILVQASATNSTLQVFDSLQKPEWTKKSLEEAYPHLFNSISRMMRWLASGPRDGYETINEGWPNLQLLSNPGPRQLNAYDCGAFVCATALCLCRGAAPEYRQDDIDIKGKNFRGFIAAALLYGPNIWATDLMKERNFLLPWSR
jgi:hypothetical protein